MALQTGTRLGPYEVVSRIGAGGMGEVWLATELRLGRKVALKLLPADLTRDPVRIQRFEQEARAASALNHPNVCTIHALGETEEAQHYIAMEYVEGDTLRQRLATSRLTLREALDIAIQVAAALSAAHAAGIVHRDIKPENVMLRPDGFVKVLDFGLAKLAAVAPPGADTTRLGVNTDAGTVVGTAAYMSPEQARGQPVDARTDIWSLGVLLYEMFAGRSPFAAPSGGDLLVAILQNEPPPLARFDPDAPAELQRILTKTLRKDRSQRYQMARDLLLDLQALRESPQSHARSASGPAPSTGAEQTGTSVTQAVNSVSRSKRRLVLVAAIPVILGAGAMGWWGFRDRTQGKVDNAEVRGSRPGNPPGAAPRVIPLTTLRGPESWPTFSPDASHVAFVWGSEKGDNFDIYIKTIGGSEIRRLTSHPLVDSAPSWSPDGRQIAYIRAVRRFPAPFEPYDQVGAASGVVHVISPLGGSDMELSGLPVSPPLAWTPDGRYLAARYLPEAARVGDLGIHVIAVASGDSRPLTRAESPTIHMTPAFSPNGHQVAYTSCTADRCEIQVLELDERMAPRHPPRRLAQTRVNLFGMSSIAWTADSRSIVYSSMDASTTWNSSYLWKVAADGAGPPERLELAGVGATMPAAALSRDYLAFTSSVLDMDIFRFKPGGPAQLVAGSTVPETDPRFSPDGRRLAFSSARSDGRPDIWIADSEGSNARQLTRGPGSVQGSPSWSPDGRQIAFDSLGADGRYNIWLVDADGGRPHQLTHAPGNQVVPSWSRDGRGIYFAAAKESDSFAIWRLPISRGAPQRMTGEGTGRFTSETADGALLVYQAADADSALLAMPVAGGAPRQLVPCVKNAAFGVGAQGVYYVPCGSSADPPLHLVNPDSGHDRFLGRLERLEQSPAVLSLGLSVGPDGSVLYPRNVTDSADLMLIENFR
jgi:serine/threonine protein kinase/Tol biopolymer transport system component